MDEELSVVADASRALARAKIPIGGDAKRSIFRVYRDVRFSPDKRPYRTNAAIPGNAVRRICALDESATALLRAATAKGHLSARALDRIARVARTIADLAGSRDIATAHLAEAIGYRTLERRGLAA